MDPKKVFELGQNTPNCRDTKHHCQAKNQINIIPEGPVSVPFVRVSHTLLIGAMLFEHQIFIFHL